METPNQVETGEFVEDDETKSAYEFIQGQIDQWTSPRLPDTGNTPWTNISGSFLGQDDNDDDGLVITNESSLYSTAKTPGSTRTLDRFSRDLVDPVPREYGEEDDVISSGSGSVSKLRVTRTSKKAAMSNNTTPKMPPRERCSTPVMSNSSTKKKPSTSSGQLLRNLEETDGGNINSNTDGVGMVGDDAMEEDDEMLPVNVQSPWVQQQQQLEQDDHSGVASSSSGKNRGGRPTNSAYSMTPRAISPFRTEKYEYRRYHDGLLTYLRARRSLSDRIDIDREEQELMNTAATATHNGNESSFALTTMTSTTTAADPRLVSEETKAELAFLKTLKSLCWERDPTTTSGRFGGGPPSSTTPRMDLASRREGNFWALLHDLRGLGLAALLWTDDHASTRQNTLAVGAFFERTATKIHSTPKELLDDMTGIDAPLVLKRRKKILQWIQHCLDQLVAVDTNTYVAKANSSSPTSSRFTFKVNWNMDDLREACLQLILAGRLNDARKLLRQAGKSILAAQWGGGAPAGIERVANQEIGSSQSVRVGNVNRALWKHQMRVLSEKLNQGRAESSSPVKLAIHSILADDYRASMENTALRRWEAGLLVILRAMWGRSEDQLLHLQNNHRRRARPPFPGTQHQGCEKAQLQATCRLASMTELGVVELLAASPFEEMKGQEHQCRAIAALLVGRMSLMDFLTEETETVTNPELAAEEPDGMIARLRFVTHLLLYLDSLSACTTPVTLEGINELKNKALFAYVDHLAGNEDLWPLLVLYASLLPEEMLVDYFPGVLVRVEGDNERRLFINQARELFPADDLVLTILKIAVRLVLQEDDDSSMMIMDGTDNEAVRNTPTRSDIRKMKVIQWLCFFEEHMGDALIAANMLLRQFLLQEKFSSAMMLLVDFLPPDAMEVAMKSTIAPNNDDSVEAVSENERYHARLVNARSEHNALQSYLKAVRAVDEWNLVLKTTSSSEAGVDDKLDLSALNDLEQTFAKDVDRRALIRQKRMVSQGLVDAAETARRDLQGVLLAEGGWLADFDEDSGFKDASEEWTQRQEEIKSLRSRLLPRAVALFHNVCDRTAEWMWKSLLASPELGSTPKEVLEAIDNGSLTASGSEEDESPMSLLSPRYWTQQALTVAETVATEEYRILEAYDANGLKTMLNQLSEIAISDQMYSVQTS